MGKMFGFEQQIFDQLIRLKEKYDLEGVKAEFEAKGSSFRGLVGLRTYLIQFVKRIKISSGQKILRII